MGECLGPDRRSTLNGERGNPQPAQRFSAGKASSGNRTGKAHSVVFMTHAAIRPVTERAGLHILLSAGTRALPRELRITKCKMWMRIVLVFSRVVALLGTATYTRLMRAAFVSQIGLRFVILRSK